MAYYDTFGNLVEDEEDRRKRELAAQQAQMPAPAVMANPMMAEQPVQPVKPSPVKQTITTDPVTGEQKIKIEGSAQDLSADNPLTPTLAQPKMPLDQQKINELTQYRQPPQATATPVNQPSMPVGTPLPPMGQQPRSMAPVAPQPMGQPPAEEMMPTQGGLGMGNRMTSDTDPRSLTKQPPQTWADVINKIQEDPVAGEKTSYKLLSNSSTPAGPAKILADMSYNNMRNAREEQIAEEKGRLGIKTGNMLSITKEIQKAGNDGNWLKYVMFKRWGLSEAAGAEAEKLGLNDKWVQAIGPTGEKAMVKTGGTSGVIKSGIKNDGTEISAKQLAGYLVTGAGGYDIVGGTFVSDTLKDKAGNALVGSVYRSKTNPNDGFVQTSDGRKPLNGFRPQSSTGSLDAQSVAARQKENIKLAADWERAKMAVAQAGPEAGNKVLGDVNVRLNRNFTYKDLTGSAPQIDIATNRIIFGQAPAETAAQAPRTQQAAPQVAAGAIAPTQMPNMQQQQAAMPLTNGSPQAELDAQAAAAAGSKKAAELTAADAANTLIDQPKNEAEADRMITLVEDSVKADGFSDAVGFKGAASLFGLKDTPFEGSDAAGWMARYGEIKGGAFLKAFETLKGGGAISDAEGKAATKAITRMTEATSEKEFKIAAKEFADNVKLGIDINRMKLRQKPIYGTPKMSERKKEAFVQTSEGRKPLIRLD